MEDLNKNREEWPAEWKRENPFKLPEDYFDTFNQRLKARMEVVEAPKKQSLWFYLKPVAGLAAAFVLVFMFVYAPLVRFMPGKNYMANRVDSTQIVPAADSVAKANTILAYFTESQFISAVENAGEFENELIPGEAVIDYLAMNCSDWEVVNVNN